MNKLAEIEHKLVVYKVVNSELSNTPLWLCYMVAFTGYFITFNLLQISNIDTLDIDEFFRQRAIIIQRKNDSFFDKLLLFVSSLMPLITALLLVVFTPLAKYYGEYLLKKIKNIKKNKNEHSNTKE